MSTCFTQLDTAELQGIELRNVGALVLEPDELTARTGVRFVTEEDDLDEMQVAAIATPAGNRFLLRRYAGSPMRGTEVSSIPNQTAGEQLRDLVGALALHPGDVQYAWDGECWVDGLPQRVP